MKSCLSLALVTAATLAVASPGATQVYRGQVQSYGVEAYGYAQGGYGYGDRNYDYGYGRHDYDRRAPSYADQFDRPGDFRCDAYWDRGRTDCHEGWRDQRRYRYGDGYGYGGAYYRPSYRAPRYGYGQGYAYGHGGATPYHGAYGRPDLVYGGGGYGHTGARDPRRIDWCRWNYRSYNPNTGYYLAYSGRYVFCG